MSGFRRRRKRLGQRRQKINPWRAHYLIGKPVGTYDRERAALVLRSGEFDDFFPLLRLVFQESGNFWLRHTHRNQAETQKTLLHVFILHDGGDFRFEALFFTSSGTPVGAMSRT
ncbi:MAG TPA: hypothetical protein VEA17_14450 [Bordetella sp.]|nr:hypothetical protein [Bordetella sp.]